MCSTGFSPYHCEAPDAYRVWTNRIANPGRTPVTMDACRAHLLEAIDEQLHNAESLADQDMPGRAPGVRDGITILALAPEAAEGDEFTLRVPAGYDGVEHADGTVHAIDLDDWENVYENLPMWRVPPVCGRASGVSSDEGGRAALHRTVITCLDCVAILA